jgi:RNA polymerase sigma-70 factor (ECF subfamily)
MPALRESALQILRALSRTSSSSALSEVSAAMSRYADGEDAAFGEVYDALAPRLYRFFVRQTGDTSRAEDLVQQTMLHMHAARASFASGSDVVPWAFAIGRRLAIDSRRRTRKEVLFDTAEDDAAAVDQRVERFAIPDALAIGKQEERRVREALARMPEAHRAAYILIRHEGLSVTEAAAVVGTTPTALKLRAHRAYQTLRAALASQDEVSDAGSGKRDVVRSRT